jgi:hypothetical protein
MQTKNICGWGIIRVTDIAIMGDVACNVMEIIFKLLME